MPEAGTAWIAGGRIVGPFSPWIGVVPLDLPPLAILDFLILYSTVQVLPRTFVC